MKPKYFDSGYESIDKRKENCTTGDMNNIASEAGSSTEMSTNRYIVDKQHRGVKSESPKREKTPNKRKKKGKKENSDNIALDNSIEGSTPETEVTSTPLSTYKNSSTVKSIMKNMSAIEMDNTIDSPQLDIISAKPKKRNKSVSFMLEDNVEVVIKKTKSNDCGPEIKSNVSPKSKVKRQFKKVKKNRQAEKENTVDMEDVQNSTIKKPNNKSINHETSEPVIGTPSAVCIGDDQISQNEIINEIKKKKKRVKKIKKTIKDTEVADSGTVDNTIKEVPDNTKKPKKKKHQEKPDSDEPVTKSRKKDSKPDVIAADLENLSIGDNAHTLTNLLDEMTVVDKEKRKKMKQKFKKSDIHKSNTKQESDKIENGPEKIKWSRRKWNKDTKADLNDTSLETTLIIENLPLSLLFNYKKVLNDHFVKYGLIKNVGIAEVYSTETSKPVFTTTINFYSDGAATQALQEDNTLLEGNCIRVKKSLPLTETTIVVRSYGILTTQFLSSIFVNAGRIRNIRHLVKGKNTMVAVFIEFDGPEAVEKAIKLAENLKAGGKKIYASRYEIRAKKNKQVKTNDTDASDADQSEN